MCAFCGAEGGEVQIVKSLKLCFHVDSPKLYKIFCLDGLFKPYQYWNVYEILLNSRFDEKLMWTERKPRLVVFGHICIKKCWQVATWFLTKLASSTSSGLCFLLSLPFSALSLQTKSLKKLFLKKLFSKTCLSWWTSWKPRSSLLFFSFLINTSSYHSVCGRLQADVCWLCRNGRHILSKILLQVETR